MVAPAAPQQSDTSLLVVTMGHRFPDSSLEAQVLEPKGITVQFLGGVKKAAALAAARDAHGVLIGPLFRLERNDFEQLPACQVVVRYGVGVDNIDVDAAVRLGKTVCYVPDYGVEEVANHSLALLLALARQLDHWSRAVREGKWGISLPKVKMHRLSTSTLGVIGAGRIGKALIRRARPIWGRILVNDPYVNADEVRILGGKMTSLDNLLSESAYVSIHVPSNPETQNLLSAEKLRLLPEGAILVNCSRGNVIDETALTPLLIQGHIQRVGLDVFVNEPPEPLGLVKLEQVWPTPHVAYLSVESVVDLRRQAAEEAGLVLLGKTPRNPIALPDNN